MKRVIKLLLCSAISLMIALMSYRIEMNDLLISTALFVFQLFGLVIFLILFFVRLVFLFEEITKD